MGPAERSTPTPPAAQPEAITASEEHLEHAHRALRAVVGRTPCRSIGQASDAQATHGAANHIEKEVRPLPHRLPAHALASAPSSRSGETGGRTGGLVEPVRTACRRALVTRSPSGGGLSHPATRIGTLLACSTHLPPNVCKAHSPGERSIPHAQPKLSEMLAIAQGESARFGGRTAAQRPWFACR